MRRSLFARQRTACGVLCLLLLTGACTANGGGPSPASTAPTSTTPTSTTPTSIASSATTPAEATATAATPVVDQPFGPSCPNLPATGPGSLQDLAGKDWVIALAGTPALSQWSVITTVAGLQADFAKQSDVTVFVPVDTAFVALGIQRIRQLLTDPSQAGNVLRYHVVTERLSPEQLPGSHPTMNGKELEVSGSGESFTVNGTAHVICGNLHAANGTIYLIDQVLQP